jgi:hypothetical protein
MSEILNGVRDYLSSGGLFNPELMDHQRTRDLIIECRDEIERLRAENNVLASLLTCWLDPMLQGEDRWAISAETLEQLLKATKKALENRL